MDNERVVDKRKIKLEELLKEDFIPLYEGRPERNENICRDDLTNLEIMLNKVNTVEDFISTF